MIFAASWAISARLYSLSQRFAPSNIVIRRVHPRTGIKWGPLVGLAGAVAYGLLMVVTGTIVRDSGPGWVNLFALVGFWNTVRFTALIPASLVRLLRVRHQERSYCATGSTPPQPTAHRSMALMCSCRPRRAHEQQRPIAD